MSSQPTPPACRTTESTFTSPSGESLYTKTWHPPASASASASASTPSSPVRAAARLIFIHGFSDHCNTYGPLFPLLAARGIETHAFDQAGWGRSVRAKRQRGLTGGTEKVLGDVSAFVRRVLDGPRTSGTARGGGGEEERTGDTSVPTFLMGHSMGGGEVLYWLASEGVSADLKGRLRGYLVEAPFIALHPASRPWKATVALGRMAGRVLPNMQLVKKLEPEALCRDPDVVRAYVEDRLCHDTGTLEGLAGMLDRGAELEDGKVKVREGVGEGGETRLWVAFGSGDRILNEEVCRRWFEQTEVKDKEYRLYEGRYHKLHAEPGEEKFEFARDVGAWILERSGPLVGKEPLAGPKL